MHILEKKVTALLRNRSQSFTEELGLFFTDLLTDLKRINRFQIKKTSSLSKNIKDKLIINTLSNTQKFINEFNTHLNYHTSEFADIILKHRIPKSVEEDNDFQLVLNSFKKDLETHIDDIVKKAEGLIGNLEFIEENYEITLSQQNKTDELKEDLAKISALTYDHLMESLLTKKLS